MLWYSSEVPHHGTSLSIHNICFRGEIRKNINTFGMKKKSILSRAMINTLHFWGLDTHGRFFREIRSVELFEFLQSSEHCKGHVEPTHIFSWTVLVLQAVNQIFMHMLLLVTDNFPS